MQTTAGWRRQRAGAGGHGGAHAPASAGVVHPGLPTLHLSVRALDVQSPDAACPPMGFRSTPPPGPAAGTPPPFPRPAQPPRRPVGKMMPDQSWRENRRQPDRGSTMGSRRRLGTWSRNNVPRTCWGRAPAAGRVQPQPGETTPTQIPRPVLTPRPSAFYPPARRIEKPRRFGERHG